MAAGLGFKTFNTGDVLSAADVNGYLMQGVLVFADATARDAAITSPQEGQFAFLKNTNVTTYYTGSAWANLDTTGMTNPMTTTGDTIYSSSGSTPARLGIGTAGQVLQVNSGATAPEWATPAAGGGLTLLQTLSLTGSSVTTSTFSTSYKNLYMVGRGIYGSAVGSDLQYRINGDTGSNYEARAFKANNTTISLEAGTTSNVAMGQFSTSTTYDKVLNFELEIPRYNESEIKAIISNTRGYNAQYSIFVYQLNRDVWNNTAAITSMTFGSSAGNFSAGTIYIYGVN